MIEQDEAMNTSPRTFFIAGVQHRPNWQATRDAFAHAAEGSGPMELQLVGEPTNPYDRYAVKVMAASQIIGYVPKPINVDFWALHDAGYKSYAKILNFYPDASPWKMYEVEVTFTKS